MDATGRTAIATTVFSTWVVLGLFLDGWAHNAGKPEGFWTPWHGVLYSGFAAGATWFVAARRRDRRQGQVTPIDPLTTAGFALFAVGGSADAVWHSVLGVEEDVAALLSPTHLLLLVGGLLLICGPLRLAGDRSPTPAAGWRHVLPELVAITLSVAVVGFFLQFLSPFHGAGLERYGAGASEAGQLLGIASVLVTNLLVVAAVALAARRWDVLPAGAFTLVVGAPALLWSSLEGFEAVELTLAAVGAGVVADGLARRGATSRTLLVATPATLWLAWFAIHHAGRGLDWPAEYWTGVTVLAVLSGWGVDLLRTTRVPDGDAAPEQPVLRPWGEPAETTPDRCVGAHATAGSEHHLPERQERS